MIGKLVPLLDNRANHLIMDRANRPLQIAAGQMPKWDPKDSTRLAGAEIIAPNIGREQS